MSLQSAGALFAMAASAAPFDWTSLILTLCFGALALLLIAALVQAIVRMARKQRPPVEVALEAEGAREAVELHRREQLERRALERTPAIEQNMAGTGGAG